MKNLKKAFKTGVITHLTTLITLEENIDFKKMYKAYLECLVLQTGEY